MMIRNGKVILLVLAALGLMAGQAAAQTLVFIADVPFSFSVDNVTLPAGKYEITQRLNTDAWDFTISDAMGAVKVFFATESAERSDRAPAFELTFDEIGGRYFLSRMWLADTSDGFYITKSREEKALMTGGAKPKTRSVKLMKKAG